MTQADPTNKEEDEELRATATARLEDAGIGVTAERVRVLGLLIRFNDRAWTAQELAQSGLGAASDPAAITRLYRTLHLLEQRGVVTREIEASSGRPSLGYRLAGAKSPLRFRCRSCNRLVETNDERLREQLESAGALQGLPISEGETLVLVTCSRCAAGASG